jgi:hypothetical protein
MPMHSMKTKKPTKPMLEIAEITDDAGLSKPNHPASAPTSRPSHPIHRGQRTEWRQERDQQHGDAVAPKKAIGRHDSMIRVRSLLKGHPGETLTRF